MFLLDKKQLAASSIIACMAFRVSFLKYVLTAKLGKRENLELLLVFLLTIVFTRIIHLANSPIKYTKHLGS